MAVTAQQVYNTALTLMDEVQENGTVNPDNPDYYKTKAIAFINTLQYELTPPSQTPTLITSLTDNVSVSDRLALLVLPYGLAAHMLLAEGNMSTASFFNARYDELKRKTPTSIETIEDVYDVTGGMV